MGGKGPDLFSWKIRRNWDFGTKCEWVGAVARYKEEFWQKKAWIRELVIEMEKCKPKSHPHFFPLLNYLVYFRAKLYYLLLHGRPRLSFWRFLLFSEQKLPVRNLKECDLCLCMMHTPFVSMLFQNYMLIFDEHMKIMTVLGSGLLYSQFLGFPGCIHNSVGKLSLDCY